MKKLKLSIDDLAVDSFLTGHGDAWKGTVDARSLDTAQQCNTQAVSDCTCQNPCTSDGYATIDPALCAASYGCEPPSLHINTCRPTGWCCRTVNVTGACCG